MNQDQLWAPWRMEYIRQLGEAEQSQGPGGAAGALGEPPGCFLCDAASCGSDDAIRRRRLVLVSDERGMLMLNRYPYTNGHLLVAPNEHLPDLLDMSPPQRAALVELTCVGQQLLNDALNPQGLNIGVNIGRSAGAGVPGHVHIHIVPRWAGDTNFMSTVGQIRVIPQAIEASYEHLHSILQQAQDT